MPNKYTYFSRIIITPISLVRLSSQSMSLKDFQFLGKLGEGAYSSVYKVKRMIDNEIYAIKKVKMNNLTQRQKQNALNQVRILASINHPNIIAYKQSFIDKSTNFLYIVMEFADQGDLYAKILHHTKNNTTLSENQLWSIFIQIIRGLKALHQLRILHRDLKSANVFMFSNGLIKLGDMNVSKLAKSMCKTQTGTPYYASPEVWKDEPYDKKSDMWSLGCVFYEAISLKPPFRANDMEGLFKKVTRGFYPRIPPEFSDQFSNILKMLLQVTPHLRPTCDKLLQLPLIQKHFESLPKDWQVQQKNTQNSPKNQLLKTIKLNHDSRANFDLQMPRPKYMSLIQPNSSKDSPIVEQMFQQGFPKPMQQKKLPQIKKPNNEGSKKSMVKWNEQTEIVKKLTQPSDIRNISKSLHVNKAPKHVYQSLNLDSSETQRKRIERKRSKAYENEQKSKPDKLPLLYQGRLKSIDPETLKKIIQREKQKKRVYSIIDKKF